MFNWLREIIEIRREMKVCNSCEVLKRELDRSNYEKEQLLRRILQEPEKVETNIAPPKVTLPKVMPWHVRQRMLEAEDREKARIMRNAPKPDATTTNVDELEKELGIAAENRESEATSKS